jgi:amino acid adenylation domain-containing protein/non-ribosomal peptide synthase protein (TIGR01720 family)
MGVFVRELTALYAAFASGLPSPLPPLPVQYGDFAAWQRGWLDGPVRDALLDYWTGVLAGAPPVLDLPTDRPRPPVNSFRGTGFDFTIDRDLAAALNRLSRQAGASLFMTLLGAFGVLLHRYSGQDDLVVGTPIANRNRSEIEPLIGFFINTLALRLDLSGNPAVADLLGRVRRTALDGYAHQDLPFEQLVDALQPERSLSHAPLFQVMFILQNAPAGRLDLPDLTVSGLVTETVTAKYDLTLALEETPDGLHGVIEYNTDLFAAATIERLAGHYRMLLSGFVADPAAPVAALPLLSPAERNRLLNLWHGPARPARPAEPTIARLIEAQVRRTPEAEAVIDGTARYSYRDLNRRANRLAHHLRSLGVGPEVPVGVCTDRSIDMVVALLAVLKADGAYVPLDPAYPAERVALMLEDACVPVVVTQGRAAAGLPASGAVLVRLDGGDVPADGPDHDPDFTPPDAHALAYILYTSGSTGRPKGVAIEQRSVTTFLAWAHSVFSSAELSAVLAATSICFDLSVFELFAPLTAGGKVVLADNALHLPDLPAAGEVTLINTVPSAIAALLQVDGIPPAAATINLAGEPLKNTLVQALYRRPGIAKVYNLYGPSEDTTYSTFVLTERGAERGPTIGRPIAETRAHILDHYGQPVPVGVPGELHLGGEGLARGYYGRPDLTAEKFIPDPFGPPGGRLYRTGDLARWLPDGSIDFLGRLDHQVKLRGFRIELGEIEAVLSRHPDVAECVVMMREDQPGQKRLATYIAPRGTPPDGAVLKAHLAAHLPDYMVPSALVVLPALPQTPNGKLDRRALPVPETESRDQAAAPRNATERVLAQIWSEVLGRPLPGIHDNFFELGGDSIISLQIVARARQAGLHLTPRQIFQHQTIARLADEAGAPAAMTTDLGPVSGPVPLTPIQHWFLNMKWDEPHHFNQSVLLTVPPALTKQRLTLMAAALLAHHDALRLRLEHTAAGWRQEIMPVGAVALQVEELDLLDCPAERRAAALAEAAARVQAGFDLARGPLLRALLVRFGADLPGRLLLVAHHLAVDGVSWRVLLEDLATAATQLDRGEGIALPARTASFLRWAERLESFAGSAELRAEQALWQELLGGAVGTLPGNPAAGNSVAEAAHHTVLLDAGRTDALTRTVPAAYYVRVDDILLTALADALTGWTGAGAVLVDLEGHGREDLFDDLDVSRTVGWFTSRYPVWLAPGGGDPGQKLRTVKEQLRRLPRRGIGFGLLRHLSPDPAVRQAMATLDRAEIVFNYLGQFDAVFGGGPFGLAPESAGPPLSPRGRHGHLLEITASVIEGRLRVTWSYAAARFDGAAIAGLADRFLERLGILLDHAAAGGGSYTPSDFADAGLDQEQLDSLIDELDFDALLE